MKKQITELRRHYEKIISQKFCNIEDISKCPRGDQCTCRVAAEIKAYMHAIIPDPYYRLGIDDFTGKNHNDELLSRELALKAKQKIIDYCWGEEVKLSDFSKWDMAKRINESIIDRRHRDGTNVVIYSEADSYGVKHQPTGKTFVASLIMQEAIRQRVRPGKHAQSYDWMEFSTLCYDSKNNDITSLSYPRSCDWLVVDDISVAGSSRNMNAFMSSLINPFFFERIKEKLPTILVFRSNIDKIMSSLEEKFGVAVCKIINDPKTVKVSLCEEGGHK